MLASTSWFAQAATDGATGSTSSGNIEVRVTKGDEVRISNLQDVDFGAVNSTPANKFIDFCIYSTTGSYDVTPTSNYGSGNQFQMANAGATEYIEYDLQWNNAATGTSGVGLNNAVTSNTFTTPNTTQNDCGGGVNTRMFVEVNNQDFNAATSGTYTDVLTIVITPQ